MKKHIAEDLPARKHAPAAGDPAGGEKKEDGGKSPEKRVRQAIYDIRYRARREELPIQQAYSQYMQNSNMNQKEKIMVKAKLLGKGGVQAENFNMEMKESASTSMAKALYKVFVDNKPQIDEDQLKEFYEKTNDKTGEKKYKVRVHDPKSNVNYVRYATREKISQLRARGLDVEMTEYGDPYEGERKKGEQTARVLSGRAKKDYDGDGKVESGAKEHAGAVHNAIQRRKGGIPNGKDTSSVKEEFIGEVSKMANLPQTDSSASSNSDASREKIDILPKNKKNTVVVNPSNTVLAHTEFQGEVIVETGYSKFLGMLQEKEMNAQEKAKEKKLKAKYDPSGMKANMQKQYGKDEGKNIYFATIRKQAMKEASECETDDSAKMNIKKKGENEVDPRSIPTTTNLIKNKLRAMGLKMSYEPEGEVIDERRKEDKVSETPRKPRDKAFELVAKSIGSNRMGVEPRGKKKVPGQKPPAAGEYGSERRSPEQIVRNNRAIKKQGQENMSSRFD
jgi:hypothetical protein